MGATNTRFTQNHRIKKGVLNTPLYHDESISSWLIRSALDCGTDPLVFTGFYWEKYRLWTYDLDRGFESIDSQIYSDIKYLSFNHTVELWNHSLYEYLNHINVSNKPMCGSIKWVIPRSSRNRRHHIGQYYCSYCLDEAPYLHNQWRMAWSFGCLKHSVRLVNKCSCGVAYQPHLLTMGIPNLGYCHFCGNYVAPSLSKLSAIEEITLRSLQDIFSYNIGKCFGISVDAQSYFVVLRYFINLLRRAAMTQKKHAFPRFIDKLGISYECLNAPKTGLSFEVLPIDERINLLTMAMGIMRLPREQIILAIDQSCITQKALNFEPYPKCLESIFDLANIGKTMSRNIKNPINKLESDTSIYRRWERLKRKLNIE